MGCCYSDQQAPGSHGQFNNCLNGGHHNNAQFQYKSDNAPGFGREGDPYLQNMNESEQSQVNQ